MRLEPPFVLLDTRPGDAPARLYRAPRRIVTATRAADVQPALAEVRAAVADGSEAAGMLSYEAGASMVGGPERTDPDDGPLLWFGLFDSHEPLDAAAVEALLPDPAGAWAGSPEPQCSRADYDAAFVRVADLIRAGDIYQANLTFRAAVPWAGDPYALYARLRRQALAPYAALIDTGERRVLSLSPELFFDLDGDRLTCRPMKGTAVRHPDPAADRAAAAALHADPKQRAENLMIVDLMRNDLSRVAVPGSVAVPSLFTVERYPSVHQLTSTVTARLAPERDAVDVLAAAFPCGSITGAPKRRAMEIIAEVEPAPRGVYCGAIGRIARDDARFSVAIRTLDLTGDAPAVLGLGSGIVADSRADREWAECLAKGAFMTAGARRFDLIETMAFDPEAGLLRLEAHLARLKRSAAAFGFAFDRHAARNELQAATFRLRNARRIRLLLSASGGIAIESAPMPSPVESMRVAIVPLPVAPADFRLRHKTSDRGFYDAARRAAGTDEVLFEHDGMLSEGSFTSLFATRGDGMLVTPPLAQGLLPGVLRDELIATGRAVEGVVTRDDLARGFFVGNAVRGLVRGFVADANRPRL